VKQFFKTLMLTLALSTSAYASTNYNFVYYYPPGGGSDTWASPVVKTLEQRGHKATKHFFKSCNEALSFAQKQTDPTFVVTAGLDILPASSGICPAKDNVPGLEFLTNLGTGTMYLCTVPSKANLTLKDLQGSKKYSIGIGSRVPALTKPLDALLTHASAKFNVRVIPYGGQAELRAAALAGTDIDFVFLASGSEIITEAGGSCIASSTKANHLNLPWLGDLAPGKFVDAAATFDLWTFNTVNDQKTTQELTSVFQSSQFKEFMAPRKNFVHSGLGAGISPAQGWETQKKWIYSVGLK